MKWEMKSEVAYRSSVTAMLPAVTLCRYSVTAMYSVTVLLQPVCSRTIPAVTLYRYSVTTMLPAVTLNWYSVTATLVQ